jgi:hypothetical protein
MPPCDLESFVSQICLATSTVAIRIAAGVSLHAPVSGCTHPDPWRRHCSCPSRGARTRIRGATSARRYRLWLAAAAALLLCGRCHTNGGRGGGGDEVVGGYATTCHSDTAVMTLRDRWRCARRGGVHRLFFLCKYGLCSFRGNYQVILMLMPLFVLFFWTGNIYKTWGPRMGS